MTEHDRLGRTTRRAVLRGGVAGMLGAALGGALSRTPAHAEGPRRGGTIRAGLDTDPRDMDPHRSVLVPDRQVFQSLYDKLLDTDENLKLVPRLAESWTISGDGTTYTFKIRAGVVFHDGTPLDAAAVVYNFNRMRDPKFPSARRSELGPITSVTAPDPSTVVVRLEQPYSPLLYVLTDRAGTMVSPAAAEKWGLDFGAHPVGSGPFSFVERVPLDHVTLRRNPAYWMKGLPYLDGVEFRFLPDDDTRVANVKSGDLEIISVVPAPQVKPLGQEARQPGAGFRLLEHGAFPFTGFWLNTTRPPFDSKPLRQAFSAAIDRYAIADVVLQGAAYPAYSFFPNGTPGHDPAWAAPRRDIAAARAHLAEAGQPNGFSFTMLTYQGQSNVSVAQAVQAMVADVGIRTQIQVLEAGALITTLTRSEYECGFAGWSGRPDPDFDVYPFVTKSGIPSFNFAGYVNSQVQDLLDAARVLEDMPQRVRAYSQATRILADDMPYCWLSFTKEFKLMSNRVRGFVHVPDGLLRLHGVWLTA